ncbi:MAG: beta-L-arabinofuranosidase domain-containing protein [Thermoguttaceae bacterium]
MNTRNTQTGVLTLIALSLALAGRAAEPPKEDGHPYLPPFAPATRPAFLPLPPGAVEPGGWLRDWCLAVRDGYTARMDDVAKDFRQAWAADYRMTGERLVGWGKGAWPYEGGGYWFEGLVGLGQALHDQALLDLARARLDPVVANVNPQGVLFMWWLDRNREEDVRPVCAAGGWSIWANGLLGRALARQYAATRDPRVLRVLETVYPGLPDWLGMGWGPSNAWPAFMTYSWTGNEAVGKALTEFFAAAESKQKKPWTWTRYQRMPNEQPGAERKDHGVRFLESTAPWALGYLWTGKREFLDTAMAWHRVVERDCMQPYGIPVFDEDFGPTGAFRATETCDVAGFLWGKILLLSISGQGSLADQVEQAFFNAGPAVTSRDFRKHVYFQSPNRMRDRSLPQNRQCTYQACHGPLCCTAALNRILPEYVSNMWMATMDRGLAAVHYGPGSVSALVADRVKAKVTCRTDYPFHETIEMEISVERPAEFPILLRIPGWCVKPAVTVNGDAVAPKPDASGFLRIARTWKSGDRVVLNFPMTVRVVRGEDKNAGNAPYASVHYGPLLFALPIADAKDDNTPDPAAKWNYAITDTNAKGDGITVQRDPMPAKWTWPLASPLRLRARAAAFDWQPDPKQALPREEVAARASAEEITLVPYGCTKFRISMMPVAAQEAR